MQKIFIIHGFEGAPNGGWRPWLMGKLGRQDVYACALSMPTPADPVRAEWVAEIARHVDRAVGDDIYLVGHSLGVPAIMRYLESAPTGTRIAGVVLVSGPYEDIGKPKIHGFFGEPFDFAGIRSKVGAFAVIHGDDDQNVPFSHAETLSKELGGELYKVLNGGHLNGSSGWYELPQALEAIEKMIG